MAILKKTKELNLSFKVSKQSTSCQKYEENRLRYNSYVKRFRTISCYDSVNR